MSQEGSHAAISHQSTRERETRRPRKRRRRKGAKAHTTRGNAAIRGSGGVVGGVTSQRGFRQPPPPRDSKQQAGAWRERQQAGQRQGARASGAVSQRAQVLRA